MLMLKSCPRCHGDLNVDRDMYGPYVECIQCGYVKDLDRMSKARSGTSRPSPKTVPR